MTVKSVNVTIDNSNNYNTGPGYGIVSDTHGGQNISIYLPKEMGEMLEWWRTWGPIFKNQDQTVKDALGQARVLHEITK